MLVYVAKESKNAKVTPSNAAKNSYINFLLDLITKIYKTSQIPTCQINRKPVHGPRNMKSGKSDLYTPGREARPCLGFYSHSDDADVYGIQVPARAKPTSA